MTFSLHCRLHRSSVLALAILALVAGSMAVSARGAGAADVPPVINSATLSSVLLAPTGGPVTMTATVTVPKGTKLSVALNPPSQTPPEVYTDKYGRVKVQFHWDRDANASQAAVKYTATLNASIVYPDGTDLRRSKVLHGEVEAYRWAPGVVVAKYPLPPEGISCASAKTCMVVSTGGRLAVLNARNVANFDVDASHSMSAISCAATATMDCFAVDGTGNLVRFEGHGDTWTVRSIAGAGTTPPNLTSISCVVTPGTTTRATCMATDDAGNAYLVTLAKGIIAIKPSTPGITAGRSFVSCARGATVTCTDINASWDSAFWNGTSWSAPVIRFADGGSSEGNVTGLSCGSKKNCIASNKKGGIALFDGSNGVVPPAQGQVGSSPAKPLTSIACPLSDFCLVGDANGGLYKVVLKRGVSKSSSFFNWSTASVKFPGGVLVSCGGSMTAKAALGCTALSGGTRKEGAGNVTLMK